MFHSLAADEVDLSLRFFAPRGIYYLALGVRFVIFEIKRKSH